MGAGYSQSYDGLPLLNDNFGGSGNPLVTAAVSIKGSSSMRTAQGVKLDPRNPKMPHFLLRSVAIHFQYNGRFKIKYR